MDDKLKNFILPKIDIDYQSSARFIVGADYYQDLFECEGYKVLRINEYFYIRFEGLEVASFSLDLKEINLKNGWNNQQILDKLLDLIMIHQILEK